MTVEWIFVFAMVLSLLLTGWLRRHALARRLLDIPNERSSCSGGGSDLAT